MDKHLDLKPFQETLRAGMCGPASLKIILDYYGISKTEKELADLTGLNTELVSKERGPVHNSIVAYGQSDGFCQPFCQRTLLEVYNQGLLLVNHLSSGLPS